MNKGALDGVVIADFSRVLAGPYATMLLADLGAAVIKVERPGVGDDTRQWGPPFTAAGQSTYFEAVNRNKSSVVLDLSRDGDLAREIIAASDVMVENFAPGTMARFGLDYASLRDRHQGLIYCSITGFGPHSSLPGYDLLIQAMGGLMSITGDPDGPPTKVGVALVDVLTGLHASVGILSALHHREQSGLGQHVEVNLLSSLLSALVNQASGWVQAGAEPARLGNAHPSIAPYESYSTADGDIVIAVGNNAQFAALCSVLDLPDLLSEYPTNSDRVGNRHRMNAVLGPVLATRPTLQWVQMLREVGVPTGPVNSISEAFALARSLGLEPIVPIDHDADARQVANPISLSETPPTYRLPPPLLPHPHAAPPRSPDDERENG